MFFDTFEQRTLSCPYCGHKLTDLELGKSSDKYEVFKAGLFSAGGQMNVVCRWCGGRSGINIKRW